MLFKGKLVGLAGLMAIVSGYHYAPRNAVSTKPLTLHAAVSPAEGAFTPDPDSFYTCEPSGEGGFVCRRTVWIESGYEPDYVKDVGTNWECKNRQACEQRFARRGGELTPAYAEGSGSR